MHQEYPKMRAGQQSYSSIFITLAVMTLLAGAMAIMPASAYAQKTQSNAASANWISYRGDAQRNGYRPDTLGAIPNLLWQYTSTDDPQPLFSSPLVAGVPGQRHVFFAAGDKVYCLDGDNGSALWITPSLSSTIASPLLLQSGDNGDVLYCITTVGDLVSLDPISGKTIKTLSLGAAVQNVAPVPVKTADGNRLIIGTVAGKLIAVDPLKMTIDPNWSVSLGRFGAAVISTPALTTDGKYLFVPAQDENVYVVDVAKGRVYFPIHMRYAIVGSPAIAGDNVIVANGPLITCLDEKNGRTRWAVNIGTLMQTSPAVSINADGSGVVYAGTSTGMFYAINLQDGKRLWQQNLGDAVSSSATVLQDMVLVGTQRAMLFGMDPHKGNIKWRYRVNTQKMISTNTRYGGSSSRRSTSTSTTDRGGYTAGDNNNSGTTSVSRNRRNRFGQEITIYPLSASPTVVDGKIFVGGDNLAIYTFTAQPFDASPPLVQDLKPFVNNSQNELQDVSNSRSIPGTPPVVLKGSLVDNGSGVDPSSIKVLLNGKTLPDAYHTYDPLTGDLVIYLTGIEGKANTPLKDGKISVEVQAADYLGNRASGNEDTISLRVDHNQAAPKAPTTNSRYRGRRG